MHSSFLPKKKKRKSYVVIFDSHFNCRSTSTSLGTQLSLSAPATNGQLTTPTKADSKIDLLSGDDLLALVPVGQPEPASPVASQQNALALVDMFSENNNNQPLNSAGQAYTLSPQLQQPQPSLYPNGHVPGSMLPQQEQSLYSQASASAWNSQMPQQQQQTSPVYGGASLLNLRVCIYICKDCDACLDAIVILLYVRLEHEQRMRIAEI